MLQGASGLVQELDITGVRCPFICELLSLVGPGWFGFLAFFLAMTFTLLKISENGVWWFVYPLNENLPVFLSLAAHSDVLHLFSHLLHDGVVLLENFTSEIGKAVLLVIS